MIGSVAARHRQKQILAMNYNDNDSFNSMKIKSPELLDNNRIDRNAQVRLWKEKRHVRRKLIRDLPTSPILEDYPGYTDSFLIFEEVRMTMTVDLRSVVRYQVPILLEKLLSSPAFITDPPRIQLIRTLSTIRRNSSSYLLSSFGYVCCIRIELQQKNCREIRLLYAVVIGDKRFLSGSIRNLVKEKQIDVCFEQNRKIANLTSSVTTNSTATATTTSPPPPPQANFQFVSLDKYASSPLSSTNVIVGDSAVDRNESSNTNVNSQSSFSTEVEQSSSSSNVLANRKRTRKALTQIPKGKENCFSFDNDNDDEHDQDEVIHSVGSQLSSGGR
ncbi:unnamed protein product [Adineta ricciae]|uniref:Uncharacterized protein n=1 Tax=Adineta ricciae TaxID=249248 RepID=A0A815NV71_ADIRI|nr:unnamed protein product [Adineta ricciae]